VGPTLTKGDNMDLRYPIGKFTWSAATTTEQRANFIEEIAATPKRMRSAVAGLGSEELNTPYREGGWTVRQVVHHVPDSHLNSYIRFKLALTEHEPTIKPYDEAAWAELIDGRTAPIAASLDLLEGLQPSGNGYRHDRQIHRSICVAWKPPRRAHHFAAGSDGLEMTSELKVL
jgi:hypothetical protein